MRISLNLLTRSAKGYKPVGLSADRKPTYGAEIELEKIWFNFDDVQTNGNLGKTNTPSGVFYFDVLNSRPLGFIPCKNMKLVFDEGEAIVNSVKACYGLDGLEHYECNIN